ncbi:UDP-N-acetylmuramoyl-L-alanine--D-glutamate ligase [Paenibacillus sp. N1-5-1-14]|uniref:UDP-N-acetylmuramoyl-L-alanine--D-glutamate ligase n=1 Tax=Paenibacillus radicibacter TaxID=2972488 RepID=UPI002158F064|nr:UDP-N-acetylmuramoyl-L-alanine--D-glutamate ligase [Paenibacillus radicibacter]MCR8641918.1 UDP-N-acetylmuramoyl-L-alanine--D-glutamate ligase [Paenibacillus radicibacter]
MKHPHDYAGEKVVVLGLAKSGVAAAKLFHRMGASIVVNDRKDRDQSPEAAELEDLGIAVICGGHPDDLIDENVKLLVKNPGIPYIAPPIVQAQQLGIEVVTEVEVAYPICAAPMIGITGSNGKTTTTTLVGQILEESRLKPIVAGNIGRALCEVAEEANSDNWMVVELSSFQLKGTSTFKPRIACLLNVYETHLDYHGDMEDYTASKVKLFANQTAEDTAVINWDDAACQAIIPTLNAHILPFSIEVELSYGMYVDADTGMLIYKDEAGETHVILHQDELGIAGSFNVANALAAAAITIRAGADFASIAKVLREFHGVEHRLEFVKEIEGVKFYNNSKATNAVATIKSVEAFKGNIILIAGGLDRGSDYMELLPVLGKQVKGLVTLGQTRNKINKVAELAGLTAVKTVDNEDDAREAIHLAVQEAWTLAEEGDIVLLSPACASWDMFPSFEQRGSMFKESVHNL